MKISEYICKLLGHSFDPLLWCMFEIEMKAINRDALKPEIKCRRCKALFQYIPKCEHQFSETSMNCIKCGASRITTTLI